MGRRLMSRRHSGALRAAVGLGAFVVVSWIGGFIWFVQNIPREAPGNPVQTDAVVVLTGGSGRLLAGIELLAEGYAKKLFVSGVYRGVDVDALLRLSQREPRNLECCIQLGYQAGNTHGNAEETERWMVEQGYKSLRLVTANYHMRRSLLEFRRKMPWAVVRPHPIRSAQVELESWWRSPGTARLLMSEYTKYLIAMGLSVRLPTKANAEAPLLAVRRLGLSLD